MVKKNEGKIDFKFYLYFLFSFAIVAFGQNVWIGYFCYLSAFLGLALFWKAMICLPKKGHQFLLATFWFFSVQLIQLSWMTSVTYVGALILVVYFALPLWLGIQFGLVSLMIPEKNKLTLIRVLAIAGVWTFCEWSRLFILSGFSWNPIGLTLANNHLSMQLASVFGIYGLSFWVIIINLFAFKALSDSKNIIRSRIIWVSLFVFPYFFGLVHENAWKLKMEKKQPLSVLLMQTSLLPEQKELMSYSPQSFIPPVVQWQRILLYLKENKDKPVDLIVLPEAALPFGASIAFYSIDSVVNSFDAVFDLTDLEFLPKLYSPLAEEVEINGMKSWKLTNMYWAQAISNFMNAEVILGLDTQDRVKKKNYNSAFHFRPNQNEFSRYEKQILMPLVEYFPFSWCKKFMEIYGITDAFTPGTEPTVFKGKVPLSVSICYEETCADVMRKFKKNGSQLFVNVTNDGWFPLSRLPGQHFEHGKLRAVENGVPILRACNTGITGGTDCFGKVVKVLKKKGISSEKISGPLYFQIPLESYSTLYTLWGDKFILIVSFAIILVFVFDSRKSIKFFIKKKRRTVKKLFFLSIGEKDD